MMNCSRHFLLSPTGLATSLFIFVSLIGRCTAQSNFAISITPVILIVSIIGCFCCCICFACVCHAKQRRTNASKFPQAPHDEQTQYHAQPTYSHNELQGYLPPTTRVLYPPQEEENTSQADTGTSEPVPLPDATLHQGDAPPGYEEAVRMTSANAADEPEQ